MMATIQTHIQNVEAARKAFIQEVVNLSSAQVLFKPNPEVWSITEITEHIFLAEQIGINRMWQAILGAKNNQPVWRGEPVHSGRSIEEVIAKTWQTKEKVPEVAKPRWGGPVEFWIAALRTNESILAELVPALEGLNPAQIIYPHPISGPLDIWQRIDFLRFHLQRHRQQVIGIKETPRFLK